MTDLPSDDGEGARAAARSAPVWLPAPDDAQVAATLSAAFTDRFGQPPQGVWAAPGRVNLIGEHTDYNEGLCLPMALPHRTYAAVRLREDGLVRAFSLQQHRGWEGRLEDIGPGRPQGWASYAAGVLWALRRRGVPVPGVDVVVDGRVPLGSGLSSSAALECAVAVALADLVPEAGALGRPGLADACVEAENTVAGASTGGMDQTVSLRAVSGHALLLDCADFAVTSVPWQVGVDGWDLLVMDTRAPHALVDGQYAARRRTCEQASAALELPSLRHLSPGDLPDALQRLRPVLGEVAARRVRHVVTEIERVGLAAAALAGGDFTALGDLFGQSHRSLRDDYEVSCPELDLAVETAVAAGSPGARMTGGGFGGSAIALVRAEEGGAVAEAVTAAFAEHGFTAPAFLEAVPAGPAGPVA